MVSLAVAAHLAQMVFAKKVDMIKLRHSVSPYVGVGLATLLGLAALGTSSIIRRDWTPILFFGSGFIVLFAALVATGMRNRVSYSDSMIQMGAAGVPTISIPFNRITRVENEVSTVRGLPFRRIAIYAGNGISGTDRIDVSLKHFRDDDIRLFVEVLRNNRPDLALPSI